MNKVIFYRMSEKIEKLMSSILQLFIMVKNLVVWYMFIMH